MAWAAVKDGRESWGHSKEATSGPEVGEAKEGFLEEGVHDREWEEKVEEGP